MNRPPLLLRPLDRWSITLATVGGIGWIPNAPGTFGALGGLVVAWLLHALATDWLLLFASMALCVIGVGICGVAARALGEHDPSAIVWDELATVPLVFAGLNSDQAWPFWIWPLGFILHRAFDILKPFPCRRLEALPWGWGIMADDIMAALYAAAVLWLVNGPLHPFLSR